MLTQRDLEQIGIVVDNKIAARIAPLEKNLDAIDARLGGMDVRFDNVDARLGGIEKSQKRHARDIKQKLNMIIDYFEKEWVKLQKRIDSIETHLRI